MLLTPKLQAATPSAPSAPEFVADGTFGANTPTDRWVYAGTTLVGVYHYTCVRNVGGSGNVTATVSFGGEVETQTYSVTAGGRYILSSYNAVETETGAGASALTSRISVSGDPPLILTATIPTPTPVRLRSTPTSRLLAVPGELPVIVVEPTAVSATPGSPVSCLADQQSQAGDAAVQWLRNGVELTGGRSATLTLDALRPRDAGLYALRADCPRGSTTSRPALIGLSADAKVVGEGTTVGVNITHPNGNVFDQVLLTGAAEAITADYAANKITRTSFIDLDDDIVQVEFSGPGTLTLVLDQATGPARPVNYNQSIDYMKGHAGIVITGADERTNVSVFSVGRATAINSGLFRAGVNYDGVADLAFIAIGTTNGRFGGVRTANVCYFAAKGYTGIYAPGVDFTGPVYLGDIDAHDTAQPVLVIGSAPEVRICGGDLAQSNGEPLVSQGCGSLVFAAGTDSHGRTLAAAPRLIATSCPGAVSVLNGDWSITSPTVLEDSHLTVNGRIQVAAGASFALRRSTLTLHAPSETDDPWGDPQHRVSFWADRDATVECTDSVVASLKPRAAFAGFSLAALTLTRSTFQDVQPTFDSLRGAVITGSTFIARSDAGVGSLLRFTNSRQLLIEGCTFYAAVGASTYYQAPGTGIDLLFCDDNDIRDNQLRGMKNGINLYASTRHRIVGNHYVGPPSRMGEAAIGLSHWSNNNEVSGNTLESSGSAIFLLFKSKNNWITENFLSDAGLGFVLRWASGNTIGHNSLTRVREDAVRGYRSFDNVILGNRVQQAGQGVGLYSSGNNTVAGNQLDETDRGIFLFHAADNDIRGNAVTSSCQSILATGSGGNSIQDNHLGDAQMNAVEDAVPAGLKNTWRHNYWGPLPPPSGETSAAAAPLAAAAVEIPAFKAQEFPSMVNRDMSINGDVVWDGETKNLDSTVTIASGAKLTIRHCTLNIMPGDILHQLDCAWIRVQAGGALEIVDSKIFGPERDQPFAIKVFPDAELILRNSEIHRGGSWVGSFCPLIGFLGKSAIIENNLFDDVYCALSTEAPAANVRFTNNTVVNSVEAVTLIGNLAGSTFASNNFRDTAIWGLQVWSITANIGSSISANRFESGWGQGLYDAYAGSFSIGSSDTCSNLRGVGQLILSDAAIDPRQFRVLSPTSTDVQAGDRIALLFRLEPHRPSASGPSETFTLRLNVGGKEALRKEQQLTFGDSQIVTMETTAPSSGRVDLVIESRQNQDN